jgi:alanyl-tRNA synthetase
MPIDEAKAAGAMSLFGEKYGATVRVLRMGEFSMELCGGTHVSRTGDIGLFRIIAEGGVAAGVRRIEAVTGAAALAYVQREEKLLDHLAGLLKGNRESIEQKVTQVLERSRHLEKEIEQLKAKLASSQGGDLAAQAEAIDGINVLAAKLDGADARQLRETVDQLKSKLGSAAIVLASVSGDKVSLVAGVTKDVMDRVPAGELVNSVAQQVGGKGGGRPDMAQAGGSQPLALESALKTVPDWIRKQLIS